ncbi:hypothetical protein GCM10027515_07570 [Schumannella luteola]|uniref:Uncharacterized protein n=1 Tax=Schumannella luteola TaxID=472059 RepID=A0A852Y722_9MICO|nr:hypothetical protein [Schumannella luteola]NYG98113.1 hypothetical protein [Schumannella luteola]TPX01836.1 hypothetical protein FJ656_25960 [Schumannella luteola]
MDPNLIGTLALLGFFADLAVVIWVAATGPGSAVATRVGPFIGISVAAGIPAGPILMFTSGWLEHGAPQNFDGAGFFVVVAAIGGALLALLVVPFAAAIGTVTRRMRLPLPIGAVAVGSAGSLVLISGVALITPAGVATAIPLVVGALLIGSLLAVSASLPWPGGMLRDPVPARPEIAASAADEQSHPQPE